MEGEDQFSFGGLDYWLLTILCWQRGDNLLGSSFHGRVQSGERVQLLHSLVDEAVLQS